MLDLVSDEANRIDSRFLEPACGSGNFLVPVLRRKFSAVEARFGSSEFERRHYALFGLMCIYGIELLADNVSECRENLTNELRLFLNLPATDDFCQAAAAVVRANIVNGDALTMQMVAPQDKDHSITFAEWAYLGRGMFQRRDFRYESLTMTSSFSREGTLFADLGAHEIFTPSKDYPRLSVVDLAQGAHDWE